MSKITASEVNKLRKQTGAGMMDCKNALVESKGDFDKAIDILRKKGQKIAAKRADRSASEGVVISNVNSSKNIGIIVVRSKNTNLSSLKFNLGLIFFTRKKDIKRKGAKRPICLLKKIKG